MGPVEPWKPLEHEPNKLAKEIFDEIKYGNRFERRKAKAIERRVMTKRPHA